MVQHGLYWSRVQVLEIPECSDVHGVADCHDSLGMPAFLVALAYSTLETPVPFYGCNIKLKSKFHQHLSLIISLASGICHTTPCTVDCFVDSAYRQDEMNTTLMRCGIMPAAVAL